MPRTNGLGRYEVRNPDERPAQSSSAQSAALLIQHGSFMLRNASVEFRIMAHPVKRMVMFPDAVQCPPAGSLF
jgi:hypothetical protein